jgi:hypothetical protein
MESMCWLALDRGDPRHGTPPSKLPASLQRAALDRVLRACTGAAAAMLWALSPELLARVCAHDARWASSPDVSPPLVGRYCEHLRWSLRGLRAPTAAAPPPRACHPPPPPTR